MKIVISSNTSWSIYNFRLNLARSLSKNGYKVILVAPKDKYSEILAKEFEYYDVFMNNKGTNPFEDFKTIMSYYNLYRKLQPDIVLNFTIKPNIYGTIACSWLKIKTINNIAGLGYLFVHQNLVTTIAKKLYKYSQKKANKIFFQNREDYKTFTTQKLVDIEKCDILPGSGVDVNKFKSSHRGKQDNIFRFLLIARMIWDKGVDEFVEAAKIIKKTFNNVEFLLLGETNVDNPNTISLEQIEKWEKEGIIKYLGSTDDVKEEIEKADCIVLPSYYREGTPRVLLEASSMEKPVITTNNVGCRDVIEHKVTGYICEIKNPKHLAKKMMKILNLTDIEREEMGKKGREKIIQEFDEKIVIEKYLNAIKDSI